MLWLAPRKRGRGTQIYTSHRLISFHRTEYLTGVSHTTPLHSKQDKQQHEAEAGTESEGEPEACCAFCNLTDKAPAFLGQLQVHKDGTSDRSFRYVF